VLHILLLKYNINQDKNAIIYMRTYKKQLNICVQTKAIIIYENKYFPLA